MITSREHPWVAYHQEKIQLGWWKKQTYKKIYKKIKNG